MESWRIDFGAWMGLRHCQSRDAEAIHSIVTYLGRLLRVTIALVGVLVVVTVASHLD